MEISELYRLFLEHPVVTTDSRNCPKGSIFVALKGTSFDGNAFATKALESGCAYAVLDEDKYAISGDKRYILVNDALKTLQDLAHYHREQLKTPIIEITGTNGKTTTKELTAAVLSGKHNVLYTSGNLNNQIGVPKTLLRLTKDNDIAVIETGASHPGDIKELADIVDPDYGIITNVGKAHIAGFGSFEGVIRTKGELYDYLRNKPQAIVFINNDNPYLNAIAKGLKLIRYGKETETSDLSVFGEIIECNPFLKFRWHKKGGEWYTVQTHLIGSYNIDNALAAITIGAYFDVPAEAINEALENYNPSNNRSELVKTAYNTLIVDAYNANPTSMEAALKNFDLIKAEKKMVILGDMKELGDISADEHQKVVDALLRSDIDDIWLVGPDFCQTRHTAANCRTFRNINEVEAALQEEKPEGYTILIKGSNSMKLFQLPDKL